MPTTAPPLPPLEDSHWSDRQKTNPGWNFSKRVPREREREYTCLESPVIQMLIRLDFYMIPQEVIGDYLSEIMAVSGFKIVKPISMDDM